MIDLHNRARIDYQLRPLVQHPGLLIAATQHAIYMSKRKRLTHVGPWFSRAADRVSRQTTEKVLVVAENIAYNTGSDQIVFERWMRSSGHRQNILNPRLTHIAWATSGSYHCVLFAGLDSLKVTN